jgi:hypothetical protein
MIVTPESIMTPSASWFACENARRKRVAKRLRALGYAVVASTPDRAALATIGASVVCFRTGGLTWQAVKQAITIEPQYWVKAETLLAARALQGCINRKSPDSYWSARKCPQVLGHLKRYVFDMAPGVRVERRCS